MALAGGNPFRAPRLGVHPLSAPGAPSFHVQPAPGGSYHVYPDGRKVYVSHPATVTPASPASPADPSAAAAQPDPSGAFVGDSTYLLSQAGRTAKLGNDLAANDQQGATSQANFTEALRRLSAQQPQAEQTAREGANRQGLFYSGYLGQQLGNIATSFAQRRADMVGQQQGQENARLAARAALNAGYTIDQAADMAAAADRQIASDQTAAGANALTGAGVGATANGVFGGVTYVNGRPVQAPTAGSVIDSGSLQRTGLDASAQRPAPAASPTLASVERTGSLVGTGLDASRGRRPRKR